MLIITFILHKSPNIFSFEKVWVISQIFCYELEHRCSTTRLCALGVELEPFFIINLTVFYVFMYYV